MTCVILSGMINIRIVQAYDEETEHVADVINKRLMCLKAKGFVEHVLVYILKSENPNGVLTSLSAEYMVQK